MRAPDQLRPAAPASTGAVSATLVFDSDHTNSDNVVADTRCLLVRSCSGRCRAPYLFLPTWIRRRVGGRSVSGERFELIGPPSTFRSRIARVHAGLGTSDVRLVQLERTGCRPGGLLPRIGCAQQHVLGTSGRVDHSREGCRGELQAYDADGVGYSGLLHPLAVDSTVLIGRERRLAIGVALLVRYRSCFRCLPVCTEWSQ